MKLILSLLCFFILLGSCTIQKRVHSNGYYVSVNKALPNVKTSVSDITEHKIDRSEIDQKLSLKSVTNAELNTFNPILIENKREIKNLIAIKPISLIHVKDEVCDIITMKNGDEINVKIIEIGTSEIKYKKCDNLDGPIYAVSRNDVFMIKFINGTKEVISSAQNSTDTNKSILYSESEKKEINLMALLGFILSFFIPIVGLVISVIGLKQIKANPEKYAGRNLAIAGILIGAIWLFALIILFI